jgi:radical SAM protein with 4Fe4S-binding SPASM domain
MPKCSVFKNGVTISPTGAVRPCCAFEVKEGTKNLFWDDDWQTRHTEWSKRSETEWLDECAECKLSEENTGKSLRTRYNEIFEHEVGIKHWDLKINNTCNFACRMCDQTSSSTWAKIVRDNEAEWETYYDVKNTTRWASEAIEFTDYMLDASHVKFTGGEPFMIPQVKKIIQRLIDEDVAPAITLELITNGSHDLRVWSHLFEKFKRVNINISIEAVGDRYEYIRPGSSWLTTSENAVIFNKQKPSNTYLTVTVLPMVFNRNNLDEVVDWCKANKIMHYVSTPVIDPAFMSPDAMQNGILRKTLIKQSKIMDKIHGTNYQDFI